MLGDFNNPLSTTERPPRQKISAEMVDLNYTLDQIDVTDIY